ncbi:U2 small nuclear ribonucleoprotein B'' [Apostasia shenzhenica]|uniref:U2 small nuclear ribonucleoprotein B n=1 Tax=Apostasia shenzhenica TaxID=1088818 RepID=A0A2I0AEG6_9ASPA|nr:U2 small nuclear ribonucleoprotein B'' [Apostasia shenzhenica]
MEDAYWNGQPPNPSPGVAKRQRTEVLDVAAGAPSQEVPQNIVPTDEQARFQGLKDSRTLGSSYDQYLQNQPLPAYGSAQAGSVLVSRSGAGEVTGVRGGIANLPFQDPVVVAGPGFRSFAPPVMLANNHLTVSFRSPVPVNPLIRPMLPEREMPLPPDASNTLFVEGLPRDSTDREVAHIFRPFLGFREIRLVKKEPKYDGGSPVLLCFVDFNTPACAMAAMNALEGYRMDLQDPDSSVLRLQFARFAGRRPSQGFHGRR